MFKKKLDPPQFAPTGYELLPVAYDLYLEPTVHLAKEMTRRALADGKIIAMLLAPSGKRHPIPQYVWDRMPVAEMVYPRFDDGWMQMELEDEAGSVVEGWIYLPLKMLKEIAPPTLSYDPTEVPDEDLLVPGIAEVDDTERPSALPVQTRRDQQKAATQAKYERWYDEPQEIKRSDKYDHPLSPQKIARQIVRNCGEGNADTIRRRLDADFRGWSVYEPAEQR